MESKNKRKKREKEGSGSHAGTGAGTKEIDCFLEVFKIRLIGSEN